MIVLGTVLMSGFGIYFQQLGLPIMSLLGGGLLAVGIMRLPGQLYISSPDWGFACLMPLTLGMLVAVLRGQLDTVTWFGVAFGAVLFVIAVNAHGLSSSINRAVETVLLVHLTAWAIQAAHLIAGLGYLDYNKILTGSSARHLFVAGPFLVTRFTGLFEEPAHLGLLLNMVLFVRWMGGRKRPSRIEWTGIVAILTTLSASSYLFLGLIIAVTGPRTIRTGAIGIGLMIVIAIMFGVEFTRNNPAYLLAMRLVNPLDDPSGRLRLIGGFVEWWAGDTSKLLLGRGVGATDGLLLTNGLVVGLWQFGLIGLLLLVFGVVGASTAGAFDGAVLAATLFSLLLAPMWTNPWWWLWFALIRHHKNHEDEIGMSRSNADTSSNTQAIAARYSA